MLKILIATILLSFSIVSGCPAQNDTTFSFKNAKKENRERLYAALTRIINKNLQLPLTDSTKENWQYALDAVKLLQLKTPYIKDCILSAFETDKKKSLAFDIALMQTVYSLYPDSFIPQVKRLLSTKDSRLFALCANYLLQNDSGNIFRGELKKMCMPNALNANDSTILDCLRHDIENTDTFLSPQQLKLLLKKDFLKGQIIMYSFQRHCRDYPGVVLIREVNGNFVTTDSPNIFSVPQLGRSLGNYAYYFPGGNTPQGIYQMRGFAISRSNSIGPSPNIQMAMPFEIPPNVFCKDTTITDSVWDIARYRALLPDTLKNYYPLYQSYFAGKAGRTEIIAHGTVVDPEYYKKQAYYPHTPGEGCLSSVELWDTVSGKRLFSNQQKICDALKAIGGAYGYCLVIELNDVKKPVAIEDILPLLP